jgi:hypothetical protein
MISVRTPRDFYMQNALDNSRPMTYLTIGSYSPVILNGSGLGTVLGEYPSSRSGIQKMRGRNGLMGGDAVYQQWKMCDPGGDVRKV